jgi:hypothetical protein
MMPRHRILGWLSQASTARSAAQFDVFPEGREICHTIGRAPAFGPKLLHVAHCHQIHER